MLKQQGYLLIDHTFSPGIPEDIALSLAMDPKMVGEGKRLEADTLTCAHCKCVVMKNPLRIRERENCPKCGHHYICDSCAALMRDPNYSHLPYEKFRDLTLNGETVPVLGSPSVLLNLYS